LILKNGTVIDFAIGDLCISPKPTSIQKCNPIFLIKPHVSGFIDQVSTDLDKFALKK
jgi:hypothetical protein